MLMPQLTDSGFILICTVTEFGSTIGLNDRELGFMGVIKIASMDEDTIDPPHDMLYAVEPVGVEIISPSVSTSVRCSPLI